MGIRGRSEHPEHILGLTGVRPAGLSKLEPSKRTELRVMPPAKTGESVLSERMVRRSTEGWAISCSDRGQGESDLLEDVKVPGLHRQGGPVVKVQVAAVGPAAEALGVRRSVPSHHHQHSVRVDRVRIWGKQPIDHIYIVARRCLPRFWTLWGGTPRLPMMSVVRGDPPGKGIGAWVIQRTTGSKR